MNQETLKKKELLRTPFKVTTADTTIALHNFFVTVQTHPPPNVVWRCATVRRAHRGHLQRLILGQTGVTRFEN